MEGTQSTVAATAMIVIYYYFIPISKWERSVTQDGSIRWSEGREQCMNGSSSLKVLGSTAIRRGNSPPAGQVFLDEFQLLTHLPLSQISQFPDGWVGVLVHFSYYNKNTIACKGYAQ